MNELLIPDLALSNNGGPYLTRWNLGFKLFVFLTGMGVPTRWLRWLPQNPRHTSRSALLHHIEGPDPDRHQHNHPWPAVAIILRGGYRQVVTDVYWVRDGFVSMPATRFEDVRWFNVLRVNEYHRITSVKPNTWTITLTGRLLPRGWGFLVGNGKTESKHVDHKNYLPNSEDDQ